MAKILTLKGKNQMKRIMNTTTLQDSLVTETTPTEVWL